LAKLKDALYKRIGSRMPAATLTELVKYSSERYADFMRENSKQFMIVTKTFLLK